MKRRQTPSQWMMQTWLQQVHSQQKMARQGACCVATLAQRSPPSVTMTCPGLLLCIHLITAGLTHHTCTSPPTLPLPTMPTNPCAVLVDTQSAVWRWRGRLLLSAFVRRCTHPEDPSHMTEPPYACVLVLLFLPALPSQCLRPVSSQAPWLSFLKRLTVEDLLPAPALPVMFPLQSPLLLQYHNCYSPKEMTPPVLRWTTVAVEIPWSVRWREDSRVKKRMTARIRAHPVRSLRMLG